MHKYLRKEHSGNSGIILLHWFFIWTIHYGKRLRRRNTTSDHPRDELL
jgi:hypothetical protein